MNEPRWTPDEGQSAADKIMLPLTERMKMLKKLETGPLRDTKGSLKKRCILQREYIDELEKLIISLMETVDSENKAHAEKT